MSAGEGAGDEKQEKEEPILGQGSAEKSLESDNANDALKALADQLSDPALKSSARVVILMSLSINKKLSFIELLELTGLGKGSLENHLDRLSNSLYIRTRNIKTFGGMREMVEITTKGEDVCRSLLTGLKNVRHEEET